MPDNDPNTLNLLRDGTTRRVLTLGLVSLTLLAVVILSVAVIYVAVPAQRLEASKYVFGAVLPMVGSWVGTVLAFYFSRESFAAATRSVTDMAKNVAGLDILRSIRANTKMILRSDIKAPPPKPEDQLLLTEIIKFADDNSVNRIPVFDSQGRIVYMIHRSMIDKFLARFALTAANPADLKTKSLKDLLDASADIKAVIVNGFGIIGEEGTLADAKLAMDQNVDCLDVFVTKTGTKTEPVTGWLTNLIINENAKV